VDLDKLFYLSSLGHPQQKMYWLDSKSSTAKELFL